MTTSKPPQSVAKPNELICPECCVSHCKHCKCSRCDSQASPKPNECTCHCHCTKQNKPHPHVHSYPSGCEHCQSSPLEEKIHKRFDELWNLWTVIDKRTTANKRRHDKFEQFISEVIEECRAENEVKLKLEYERGYSNAMQEHYKRVKKFLDRETSKNL